MPSVCALRRDPDAHMRVEEGGLARADAAVLQRVRELPHEGVELRRKARVEHAVAPQRRHEPQLLQPLRAPRALQAWAGALDEVLSCVHPKPRRPLYRPFFG